MLRLKKKTGTIFKNYTDLIVSKLYRNISSDYRRAFKIQKHNVYDIIYLSILT